VRCGRRVSTDVKFSLDTSRLAESLQQLYADKIKDESEGLMKRLSEELNGYRCEVHGEQLTVVISWGPNSHCGVLAGYWLEGCCSEFVDDVCHIHFRRMGDA
jgi:hypothetical protein